jgi:lincosamide nucleotidyltransferase A/C/D/E
MQVRVAIGLLRPLGRRLRRGLAGTPVGLRVERVLLPVVHRMMPSVSEDLLHSILGTLRAAGVPAWVVGGWGVDALVGRATRRHRDLDLLVDRAEAPRACRALEAAGFGRIEVTASHVSGALMPDRIELQDAGGHLIDLHPVDLAFWPPDRPGEGLVTGRLSGRPVPCVDAALQETGRRGYALADTDRRDLALLRRFVDDAS